MAFRIQSVADFNEQFFIHLRRSQSLNDMAISLHYRASDAREASAEKRFIYKTTASMFEKWAVEEFNLGLQALEAHLAKGDISDSPVGTSETSPPNS